MSFSNQERINATAKALLGNVLDSDPTTQWYEGTQPFGFVLANDKVWTQANVVRANPCANLAAAQAACAGPLLGIVQDYSLAASAIRLTKLPSLNNTYVALAVYNNFASQHLDNWVKPQFAPQLSGSPSFGFATKLYNGNPALGGVEVLTTDGTTGTGVNKSVGWIWNYDNGLLLLANDFSVADPWILGFRYIGTTAGSGGGSGHNIIVDGVSMPTEPDLFFTGVEGEDDPINGWTIVKFPRQVTTMQRVAMAPVYGYMVFDTDLLKLFTYNGTAWEMV